MPNKIYQVDETTLKFNGEVGADVAWSIEGLATAAGRQSAHHSLGTVARARRYKYRLFIQFQLTPTVGNVVRLYLKTSDGTHPDNDDGTGDIAVSAEDKLKNLKLVDILAVDQAAANIETVVSGEIEISAADIAFAIWNESGAAINATDSNSGLLLTPVPDEIQ